ncbi:MAG: hypothetical protein HQL24_09265 [Candidatus Omnitrophica bacterium]|nr:hypothetical protein [Candidatus Omnitrophota bacterium]
MRNSLKNNNADRKDFLVGFIRPSYRFLVFMLFLAVSSLSCSPISTVIQPEVNGLVVAGKYHSALAAMEQAQENYGTNNRLLFDMDYALVLHYAGKYEQSASVFDRAKRAYDELYTVSLSKEGATWLVNDNVAPYRGEDFERVMINIFEALDFAALGNFTEALVEARDVDLKLRLINSQYKSEEENVYKEDAFARFLMGILYEAQGTAEGYNDAFIEYEKAVKIYENEFLPLYHVEMPDILKQNMLAVAQFMGDKEFQKYQQKWGKIPFLPLKERNEKAEVYLVHYAGLSPIKHQIELPIPLPGGYLAQLAFPVYEKRVSDEKQCFFRAVPQENLEYKHVLEKGEDIGAIAIKSLENRRARVIAKAVLRSGAKYFLEREGERIVERQSGQEASRWFRYLSSLYNITSEQADLRSWQTLPQTIEISRLLLEPGTYQLFLDNESLGTVDLKAGEKKFIVRR